ncbi:DNA topoisomerase I [archaeon]|jgi:DNA topoisomerase I|nr:DNA topoisomerase I [archaeon]MBT3577481.1 DNA topoisomerase I [archaeon]MBT6820276.1 DNA topoisomerase I [archaeon]MBT6955918.1 DNA topoisomerase I [archaeon]MBT7025090.1 DNA topoisomerase I [archaeon]
MVVKKERNATLIICEKPAAAAKIAAALSDATDEKLTSKEGVAYYEFFKKGRRYIIGCAVGHLFGIQQIALRGPFPNFEVEWKPSFNKKRSAHTKRYLQTLKRLAKEVDEAIVATDFDVEGEVIGWNVVRFVLGKKYEKVAKRMKFSSLTKEALEESFENLIPTLNWGAAIAGETRHYLDWFYGINLSRGLMKAIAKAGAFRILSIGRVQGPALKIVVDREREIQAFEPEPYWQIFLQVKNIKGKRLEVKYPKDIFKQSELLRFKHLKGKSGTATTIIKVEDVPAPTPFDLTTLQTEAYKYCGTTPTQTLRAAQNLYLAGAISYPRTSSQKYPAAIGYDKILKKLKKYTTVVKYAKNKKPTEGKKEDPAHPAIYPTGEAKKVPERDKKIYDLIVKRFISCFCDSAKVENKNVKIDVGGLKFGARGVQIKDKGWMNVYPTSIKESEVPTMDGEVDVLEIRTEEKQTKPPRRYSAASLVKNLEKKNLGTKATRAGIVETLFTRGYAKGRAIEVTELGMRMAETLEKFSPIILDEELTGEMTKELEKIEVSDKDLEKKEQKILDKAKKSISKIAEGMTKNLEAMGKSLADANAIVNEQEREENTMTQCPKCKKGNLRVMYGKRFSRYFVSCDAYPECKNIYSLPPRGLMKPARMSKKAAEEAGKEEDALEMCEECGFPLVMSFQKGRSPWKFCFNPECSTNEELTKKKEEFKKKLASGEIEIGEGGKVIDHTKKKKVKKKSVKKKSGVKKAKKKASKKKE